MQYYMDMCFRTIIFSRSHYLDLKRLALNVGLVFSHNTDLFWNDCITVAHNVYENMISYSANVVLSRTMKQNPSESTP